MTPVLSSNIKAVGYDRATKVLAVEFKNGGLFHYEGVPADLPEKFVQSDSKGQFFNTHVKGAFKASRVS